MTAHAGYIPVDALYVRFGANSTTERRLLTRLPQVELKWQNILSVSLDDLTITKERALTTLKFLDTWEEALRRSYSLSPQAKKDSIQEVRELAYEVLWAMDWEDGDEDILANFMKGDNPAC